MTTVVVVVAVVVLLHVVTVLAVKFRILSVNFWLVVVVVDVKVVVVAVVKVVVVVVVMVGCIATYPSESGSCSLSAWLAENSGGRRKSILIETCTSILSVTPRVTCELKRIGIGWVTDFLRCLRLKLHK